MTGPEESAGSDGESPAAVVPVTAAPPAPPGAGFPASGGETLVLPTSGMAIASLVFGIVGIVLVAVFPPLAILPALPAVVFGYLAQGTIGRSRGTLGGASLAKAGMILGYVGIGFGALMFLFFGLLFGGMALFFTMSPPMGPPMSPGSAPVSPVPTPAPAVHGEPLPAEELEAFEEAEFWETLPEAEMEESEDGEGSEAGSDPADAVEPGVEGVEDEGDEAGAGEPENAAPLESGGERELEARNS